MNKPLPIHRQVVAGRHRMTPSEAFVETLVAQGVTDVFGIVGSAYMDALDLFPAAGIRFVMVAHEQGAAHMADGYARVSGKHGVCISRGMHHGVLLPQVATDHGWDRETFLDHVCLKAGLPTDAWRDSDTILEVFSAEVFGEGDDEIKDL